MRRRLQALAASAAAAGRSLAVAIVRRADALEAVTGLTLMAAGVALIFSLGAALIVAGAVLLLPAIWPQFRRR